MFEVHQVKVHIFGDAKNVHFYLMYLKHGSITLANIILR